MAETGETTLLAGLPFTRETIQTDRFTLGDGDVHVWTVPTEAPDDVFEAARLCTSSEECERAARFHHESLRRSYILARASLRNLLAGYLKTEAARIEIQLGPNGKPELAKPARLRFNVSHSGALALFAFALDCPLGVDVEKIRPIPELADIAARLFCAEETADLMALGVEDREQAFFLGWTRKEAYIKAIGEGLGAQLDSFRVTLKPGESARFLRLPANAPGDGWTLHHLSPNPGYAAALVYGSRPRDVRAWPILQPGSLLAATC